MNKTLQKEAAVTGEFVNFAGERYYVIRNVDKMNPFFVSVVSNDDHWLFMSSTGGLTAGRVSPDTALFPYVTVDKVHESAPHTGPRTIIRVDGNERVRSWEPFNREQDGKFATTRHFYKYILGNKVCLEETNHDLGLTFRYFWLSSDEFGFVRHCELENFGDKDRSIEILDGLQNILPAGTPRFTQTNSSNLVDAYKWTELDEETGLAYLTLYSGISDRAEPCESLKATTVFCLGLDNQKTLISSAQLNGFQHGGAVQQETHKRGIRGAYFVNSNFALAQGETRSWDMVANLEQSQAAVVALRQKILDNGALSTAIQESIERGSDELARIMASGDAFQATREENVSAHHYANVLFNILRGGIFDDQYRISGADFRRTVRHFNAGVYASNEALLSSLPDRLSLRELLQSVADRGDAQLTRLAREYLPITFGRRHGDPSRPWNQFEIKLKDENGDGLLSYQGNWRDIFQNWEALALSYPDFTESMIAKFVNASTVDGYNPYRITKEGIDWEVEEPDNPWSYIGYWGDHQIIYLQKLLELSKHFSPAQLHSLLREEVFCYANVPYKIKPFSDLLEDPKNTVLYDEELAETIDGLLETMGADGKLILDRNGQVYQVNLIEKLTVPLLAKLSNLVVDGGIWLNTQRPEWNDANNALVGYGLSMVTLYYMRRYVRFLEDLFADDDGDFEVSSEVATWLTETTAALASLRSQLDDGKFTAKERMEALIRLGEAASHYRDVVYRQRGFSGKTVLSVASLKKMLGDAMVAIDRSIATNRRDDGLYHAYNLMDRSADGIKVDTLYPMLEGQVAILSAGAIDPKSSIEVVESLFNSSVYREDQNSFMLYPDRKLPGFLEKNRVAAEKVESIPLLTQMLENNDRRIVLRDPNGDYRFNADFTNASDVSAALDRLKPVYGDAVDAARDEIRALFEKTFNHKAFTGRSGTMFGFEGLGSIYWHMVAKLLLAVMENFFSAIESGAADEDVHGLGKLYYRIREGIGFNKTPEQYGAFPTDPYSHTPRHAGARQPGMTGQVKEEIISRFGELGVRVQDGVARFEPALLRKREFLAEGRQFTYLDVHREWRHIMVPDNGIAFTWCQVPVVYQLGETESIALGMSDDSTIEIDELKLTAEQSAAIFERDGSIRQVTVTLSSARLFSD